MVLQEKYLFTIKRDKYSFSLEEHCLNLITAATKLRGVKTKPILLSTMQIFKKA